MKLPGPSIPLGSAVACMDCLVVFDTASKACPKCGSEISAHSISNGRAAQLIQAQRNQLDEAEGVLLTISKRRLGPSSALAARMVDRIRESRQKEKAPASTSASSESKEGVPVQ